MFTARSLRYNFFMSVRTIPPVTINLKSFRLDVPELRLHPGEILGIFGKSGAGKTSFLKRVREMLDPHDVHYMSQFDSLLEEITVRQNIELGLAAMGHTIGSAGDWERRHEALLQDFEVNKHMHKYPGAMSGGQRKRAEIVRSLIMNPSVLLFDEPFVGIGHLFESVCTREILKRGNRKEGITMVVSHDFDLLCTFSTRVMLVDDNGVIGFVPTHERGWHPEDVRTAWTLGVENVLSCEGMRSLDAEGFPALSSGHYMGFWGWSARWDAKGAASIRIPKHAVCSVRTALQHGTVYTRMEIQTEGTKEPLALVGKGSVDSEKNEYVLGVEDAWVL